MSTVIGRPPEPGSDVLLPALDAAGFGRGDGDPYRVVVLPDGGGGPVAPHARHAGWPSGWPGGWPSAWPSGRDADRDGGTRPDGRTLVVVCSRDDLARWAWDLLAAGADDVVLWTGEETVRHVVARLDRWRRVDATVASAQVAGTIVGRSPALRAALLELVELAVYGDGPILLTGETGTGKELAARLVHDVGPGGPARPFVVVDCTTIVPTLSGSELFGHERGAFTGADRSRAGAFCAPRTAARCSSTRSASCRCALQAELLRVVQEDTYKAVGGDVLGPDGVPAGQRDEPGPRRRAAGGPVPQRPVPPDRVRSGPAAAAARADRGRRAAVPALPRPGDGDGVRRGRRARPGDAAGPAVPRQPPRAAAARAPPSPPGTPARGPSPPGRSRPASARRHRAAARSRRTGSSRGPYASAWSPGSR